MKRSKFLTYALPFSIIGLVLLIPELGFCDVERTLGAVEDKLIHGILPLLGALGIVFSAFSFFTGNPGARSHLFLAMLGALIGFGAPSIITLIQSLIR